MCAEVLVGAYNSGSSRGVVPLVYNHTHWLVGKPVPGIENASYGAYIARHDVYCMVEETSPGSVGFYRREPSGGWRLLGRAPTSGNAPCFVEVSADETMMAVANYESGNVAFYALDPKAGIAREPVRVFQNTGNGPNRKRQSGPHAHCAGFAWDHAHLVDLGADVVVRFALNGSAQLVGDPFIAFKAPAGEGPRQLQFHPTIPRAYLLTELGSKIFVLAPGEHGRLNDVQCVSSLPAGFAGGSKAAHLAFNRKGDLLYASNRGHDSIAVFSILPDGALRLIHVTATQGKSPRHFLLMEDLDQVLVAHEEEGGVTVLALAADGLPGRLMQRVPIEKPCFLLMPHDGSRNAVVL
jgi:6-phosphogluconolactonase